MRSRRGQALYFGGVDPQLWVLNDSSSVRGFFPTELPWHVGRRNFPFRKQMMLFVTALVIFNKSFVVYMRWQSFDQEIQLNTNPDPNPVPNTNPNQN